MFMADDPKEKLEEETVATEETESREVYLSEGRTLTVKQESGADLVEIRGSSGTIEVRIRLTEHGPVLQMESARLQLRATEAVEIEAPKLDVRTTESITMETKGEIKVEAEGEIDIDGKKIWLN
jgi:phage gp45-like